MNPDELAHLMVIAQGAQGRHRDVREPVEVLAAFGGFEVAMMVGVMLVAASKRHLLMIDGIAACAALMLAARIATPVTDYCVFCRSHAHRGLDRALNLFRASALLELGMDSTDGTGAHAGLAAGAQRRRAADRSRRRRGGRTDPAGDAGRGSRHRRRLSAALRRARARVPAIRAGGMAGRLPGPAGRGGSGGGTAVSLCCGGGKVPVAGCGNCRQFEFDLRGLAGRPERGRARAHALQHQIAIDDGADAVGLRCLAVDGDHRQTFGVGCCAAWRHHADQLEARVRGGLCQQCRPGHQFVATRRGTEDARQVAVERGRAGHANGLRRHARPLRQQAAAPKRRRWPLPRPRSRMQPGVTPCGDYHSSVPTDDVSMKSLPAVPRMNVRGFTLIELMVVLVIIGVLAALIVPNVLDRADDARVTAARTDVNNLMQALKLLQARQPALSERRAGPGGAGAQAHGRRGAAELEALPGQAAERPLGPALPVRRTPA